VVGRGAAEAAQPFLTTVVRFSAIAPLVEASVLVAGRRWSLYLKDGIEVLLPEDGAEHALATLSGLAHTKKLLSRDIVAVDLRLSDRVAVRLSDAAAAARAEKIRAMEKARKARRKGGAA
jgi:cell division protein FtsQ